MFFLERGKIVCVLKHRYPWEIRGTYLKVAFDPSKQECLVSFDDGPCPRCEEIVCWKKQSMNDNMHLKKSLSTQVLRDNRAPRHE
ncbi:predicted protein [Botrytis cinerea T4]|uniref:Uncharacterized protein n=1 Tax=Botryotinia fuckeliana (strain T4) TaxID=999810 RepID=G2XZP6_BOTF4|nr:predicted protein [Botrytis cinerea T4]